MLDTLGLRLEQERFLVRNNANLTVYPAQYQLNNGEIKNDFYLFSVGNQEVTGNKAILNREKYQVTIDSRGLFTQVSVPKYAHKNNFFLSGKDETFEVLNDLESSLKSEGISVDINEAKIVRLDSCKNTFLSKPAWQYFSFFNSLNAKRLKDKVMYATGYRWQNSKQQIVAYNKIEEMKNRDENIEGLPKNVIRFEHRLMNGRKVHEALGIENVRQLKNNFGAIEENYEKSLRQSIFSLEPDDKRLFQTRTIENYLEYSLKSYYRNWYLHFATSLLFAKEEYILDEKSLYAMLDNVIDRTGLGYKRKRRYQLRKAIEEKRNIISSDTKLNVRDLYAELREQVFRKVA